MSDDRNTNAAGCVAGLALLIFFVISFLVTVSQKGIAETCATWMVLPLVGILVAVGRMQ